MIFCKKALRAFLIALFWLLVWWGASALYAKPLLLPSPISVFKTLLDLLQTADFYLVVLNSLKNILIGFLSALVIGILLAIATSRLRIARDLLMPFMTVIKATPVASFIILLWILIGAVKVPALITFLIVLPIVWSNLDMGFQKIDPQLAEVAKVYRFSRIKTVRALVIPSVSPYFAAACRTSFGLAWKAGIAAEIIAMPPRSIGTMIGEAKTYILTSEVFAWTLTVILLSLLFEVGFSALLGVFLQKRSKRGGIENA